MINNQPKQPMLDIIETYKRALPPGKLVSLELSPLDRFGLPFWVVTLYPDDGPTNAGSGYGFDSTAALLGAYGELSEVVHANAAMRRMQRVRGSYRELARQHGVRGVVDPLTLCLEAGSPYTPDMPLQWVTVRRYPTNEPVLMPLEWVACQGSDVPGETGWLITLITNGLGAGLRRDDAVGHGLLEVVQRDGNSVHFRALADATELDLSSVQDPETQWLLAYLCQEFVEVIAKVAGTEWELANVYVVGYDHESYPNAAVMTAACGEAAHPDREQALRKALLEFVAARSRLAFSHGLLAPVEQIAGPDYLPQFLKGYRPEGEERRALQAMMAWQGRDLAEMRHMLDRVLRVERSVPFDSLPTSNNPALSERGAVGRLVAERLIADGWDVLVADYTPPDSAVAAVKVIVPGLEVETLSYHRIGERNLQRLLAAGSPLVGVGTPPATAKAVLLTAEAEARLGGPAWLDVAALDRLVGPLYPLYREPGRHTAPLIAAGRLPRPTWLDPLP